MKYEFGFPWYIVDPNSYVEEDYIWLLKTPYKYIEEDILKIIMFVSSYIIVYLNEQTTEDAALSWIWWEKEKKAVGQDGDRSKNTCFQSYFCLSTSNALLAVVQLAHPPAFNLELVWHLKLSDKLLSFCP